MSRILLFNKPYGVICQFSRNGLHSTLADYIPVPGFYPAGRLDTDSEGLLLLTNDGVLQHRITDPRHKLPKTYWVQVEGVPDAAALAQLRRGVRLPDPLRQSSGQASTRLRTGFITQPAEVRLLDEPAGMWPRNPPIRERKNILASWLELTIREGKNRQVRRMTAAVGYPTLRLIRCRIGDWTLEGLEVGAWREEVVQGPAGAYPVRPNERV